MIQGTITYRCRKCGGTKIVKNGTNKCGNPRYHGKDCVAYRVLEPRRCYEKREREMILQTYQERASLQGLERLFGVARQTVARWLRALVRALPDLKDPLCLPLPRMSWNSMNSGHWW